MNANAKQLPSERHGMPMDSTSSAILDAERPAAKHTEGPWNFFNSGAGLIRSENGKTIAQLKSVSRQGFRKAADLDEEVANARLIAAAPALAEALRDCLGFWQSPPDGFGCSASRTARLEKIKTAARAAIAQAEGGAQ